MHYEHGHLVTEPTHRGELAELLDSRDPLDEPFPDIDDTDLPPLGVPDLGR